jgi:protein XagA
MKKIHLGIFALLFVVFNSHPAMSTGWPQPKGGGYFKLDFYSIRARKFFGDDTKIYNINGAGTLFGTYTASIYGEYGLTKRLTAITYLPFFVRNTVNEGVGAITGEILQPGLENNHFGDVDLGFKYHFLQRGSFVMSTTLMLGLPTGDASNPNLLYTGDGEFNQFGRIDVGYGARRWYAAGFVGVNNRTNNFSEELRYQGEYGYWLKPGRLLANIKLTGIHSFNNGNPDNTGNGLFSNNVEFVSPQLGLHYEFKGKWGLTATAAGAVSGRNVLASPSISFGVYKKWD